MGVRAEPEEGGSSPRNSRLPAYCAFTLTSSITNEVWLELSSTP